jgi:hypothetical protein
MSTATEEKLASAPAIDRETEIVILDLLRERTRLQRVVRPLLDRIEEIGARLRVLSGGR